MPNSDRRAFLRTMSASIAGAAWEKARSEGAAGRSSASKPNIIIIMADQHRAGLTRRTGYPLDTMPALDQLAARGVPFDRAYCTAPLCVPSRVSMLTGRWPHAHRVRQNSAAKDAFFEKDIFGIAKSLGYRTGLAGKNHTYLTAKDADFWRPYSHAGGWQAPNAPKEFAEYDDWLVRLNHGFPLEPTPFPAEAQLPHRIVSDAIEFVRGAGSGPFLLWVSFPEPHNPYQVPRPYFDMFPPGQVPGRAAGPEVLARKGFKWQWLGKLEEYTYPGYDRQWRRIKSNYLGMLRLIDDQVARLQRHLQEQNLVEETILIYLADHGDYLTDYGLMRKGVEMPEALARIPMVWAGWGVQPQREHAAFVSIADVMPTLCEALGAEMPRGAQGRSLWPLLRGQDYPRDEFRSAYCEVGFGGLHYDETDTLDFAHAQIPGKVPGAVTTFDELNSYTQSGYLKMVRLGDWKLSFDMMGNGQLYNLAADPYELNNLYGKPPAAEPQMRLLAELLQWTIRTQDNLPTAAYRAKWAERNWYAPHRR
jgi:arylsulfatase A-like enzyme